MLKKVMAYADMSCLAGCHANMLSRMKACCVECCCADVLGLCRADVLSGCHADTLSCCNADMGLANRAATL